MKTIPLIQANLKGFLRNKKSVFLLIVFPLFLIGILFFSFSPDGLKDIPVGLVNTQNYEEGNVIKSYTDFLDIRDYASIDLCIEDIKRYKLYACIDIEPMDVVYLNVYFDNTREPVIWEIIEKIKGSIDAYQEQKSKEMTEAMIGSIRTMGERIDSFDTGLESISQVLDVYIYETDDAIVDLRSARTDLSDTLDQMDSDINEADATSRSLKSAKDSYYFTAKYKIESLESSIDSIEETYPGNPYTQSAHNTLDDAYGELREYDSQADSEFSRIDDKIYNYKTTSQRGRTYLTKIDQSIEDLQETRDSLYDYKIQALGVRGELTELKTEVDDKEDLDADKVINPLKVINYKLFNPKNGDSNNMINLQPLFPKMLILIVIFLSLLIANFISLTEINCPANIRVSVIKDASFHEFLSTYVSSLIIVMPSIYVVLFLGELLFGLRIFNHIVLVSAILFFLSTILILLGMALAYAVVKESVSILISTFGLLYLLFFSGFLLPIERMTFLSRIISELTPGKIALDAFNKVVFYNQGFFYVFNELSLLFWGSFIMVIFAYVIKTLRNL